VSGLEADLQQPSHREETIERAFGWFRHIEDRCTRFNPQSESMQLTARIGVSVPVSPVLYECVSLPASRQSGGAFDPTVGGACRSRLQSGIPHGQVVQCLEPGGEISYRTLDLERKAIPSAGGSARGGGQGLAIIWRASCVHLKLCDRGASVSGRSERKAPWSSVSVTRARTMR
jgi:hypothetical protein